MEAAAMAESKDLYGGSIAATLANYHRIRRLYSSLPVREEPITEPERVERFLELERPAEMETCGPPVRRRDALILYDHGIGPIDARRVLKALPVSARPIVIDILREHDMTLEAIVGRYRMAEAMMCRFRIYYVLRKKFRLQLTRIARAFERHHTSIMHGVEQYARFAEFEDYSVFFCSEGGRGE